MARGRVTEPPADPRNHVAKAQQAARVARSRVTHQAMERLGEAVTVLDAQVQKVRSEPPPPSKACVGWSTPLPPECIGPLIGRGGHNIQRLERELRVTRLSVEEKGGSQCVRIEAPTEASLTNARRVILDEVGRHLAWAGRPRKRPRRH